MVVLPELVPPAELGVPVAGFVPLPAPIGLDASPDGMVAVPDVPDVPELSELVVPEVDEEPDGIEPDDDGIEDVEEEVPAASEALVEGIGLLELEPLEESVEPEEPDGLEEFDGLDEEGEVVVVSSFLPQAPNESTAASAAMPIATDALLVEEKIPLER